LHCYNFFVTLSLDTKKTLKETMANNAQYRPNPYLVQYVFDNIWTMAQLEAYIVGYQPGGISLAVLRRALKYGRVDDAQYSRQCCETKTGTSHLVVQLILTSDHVILNSLFFFSPSAIAGKLS
jgi:hypothetical protein